MGSDSIDTAMRAAPNMTKQSSLTPLSTLSRVLRIDSGVVLPGEGRLCVAVEIRLPELPLATPVAFVCLPGGGMNRHFYDLVADSDTSFSFARYMTARGFVVVMVDYLGLGESDKPADGYVLTPEALVAANARAIDTVLGELRAGTLSADLPAIPDLRSIGVGHSMGAMLTVLQQAKHRQHAALVLLGFGTDGLPEYLTPEVRALAADTTAVRAQLVELAQAMFKVPYPRIGRSPRGNDLYGSSNVDARGVNALKEAIEPILPVPAYLSMLPGNVAPEAALIDVPIFLGIGDRDMVGSPHRVPASFPASRDLSLHVLPETGHSHFLFPARTGLFARLATWAEGIATGS